MLFIGVDSIVKSLISMPLEAITERCRIKVFVFVYFGRYWEWYLLTNSGVVALAVFALTSVTLE